MEINYTSVLYKIANALDDIATNQEKIIEFNKKAIALSIISTKLMASNSNNMESISDEQFQGVVDLINNI